MTDERQEWKVLGRTIGTATGWDELGVLNFCLYNFEPAEGIDIPETGCLCVMFETGYFEGNDEFGGVEFELDITDTLKDIPR